MILGEHLLPGYFGVSSASFTAKNCCQCAVYTGLDGRIVVLLLPNILFKSIQVPSDALDVQILHLAAAISPLIAAKPGFAQKRKNLAEKRPKVSLQTYYLPAYTPVDTFPRG